MSNIRECISRECIFAEDLLEFCLGRRGITWHPAPKHSQVDDSGALFNETIGNAVMVTSIAFRTKVLRHSADICNRILTLRVPVAFHLINFNIFEVSAGIYCSDDAIENTYIFLAVMVEVAVQCAKSGRQELIPNFLFIIPPIIDFKMPEGFLLSYGGLFLYAINHPNPPENY